MSGAFGMEPVCVSRQKTGSAVLQSSSSSTSTPPTPEAVLAAATRAATRAADARRRAPAPAPARAPALSQKSANPVPVKPRSSSQNTVIGRIGTSKSFHKVDSYAGSLKQKGSNQVSAIVCSLGGIGRDILSPSNRSNRSSRRKRGSHGGTLDGAEKSAEDSGVVPRRHSSPMEPQSHSYDVHVGPGAMNSSEVLWRFQNDIERLQADSTPKDTKLLCEILVMSNSLDRIQAYLRHKLADVHGMQHTSADHDLLSISLPQGTVLELLENNCAGALATLATIGLEQLRVVDEGFTVLFRLRSPPAAPASAGIPSKPSTSTLLDATLDILCRSASQRPPTEQRGPRKKKIRYYWNDKLTRRVASLLSGVFSAEQLANNLDVEMDSLPHAVQGDAIDAIFLILEEWRLSENCHDVRPRLLDLLLDHAELQQKLDESFNQWQRDAEFLPSIVSDTMLTEVARQIGNCWRSVAYELNLGRAEIEAVQPVAQEASGADMPYIEERSIEYARGMLQLWKQTSGRYATRTVLAHALGNCNLADAMDIADQCNSLPEHSQLLTLVEDLMKSQADINQTGVQESASDHRRRRLAKKRISPSATSLSSVEAQSPVQNRTGHFQRQDGVSAPWEASSLVTSGPYFGVNLDALPPRSDNSTIPLFVDKCIAFIEERAMSTRGIYRLSGISSAITELEEMYTADHNLNLFSVCDDRPDRYDENCIASSLKSFLRKIPDPVVPASITSRLVEIPTLDQDTQSMVDRLKLIVVFGMPQRNRALLQEICCHLQRVAEHASENLMKASNLAVVFWPNLLRPAMEGSDMVLMRDLPRLLQNVLTLLIEHAEEVFIENQPW
ncbi:uncharacterized protein LOC135830954 isoform X3 [Sycon ciliatum]|uniref:uncharacterized protein LOC135830954 isoform X3 n=1 Tax=Sycon ciliatum TaxID=27933 RepID=UPI0031F6C239